MADKLIIQVGAAAVALRLPSSVLENQIITNAGPSTVYTGQTAGVTAALGTPFPPGSRMELLRNGLPVFAIAAAGPVSSILVSPGVEPS